MCIFETTKRSCGALSSRNTRGRLSSASARVARRRAAASQRPRGPLQRPSTGKSPGPLRGAAFRCRPLRRSPAGPPPLVWRRRSQLSARREPKTHFARPSPARAMRAFCARKMWSASALPLPPGPPGQAPGRAVSPPVADGADVSLCEDRAASTVNNNNQLLHGSEKLSCSLLVSGVSGSACKDRGAVGASPLDERKIGPAAPLRGFWRVGKGLAGGPVSRLNRVRWWALP